MATLSIGGRDVEVGDDFLKLSPDQQNATVEEIAASLGVGSDAPSEGSAGRVAGLAGRAGVQGLVGGVAALPGLAVDGTVGVLENLTRRAYNAGAGMLGAEPVPYREPFKTTAAVGKVGEGAADLVGLPKPESAGEKVAVAAGQAAVEALTGAGLAGRVGRTLADGATRRFATELAASPGVQVAVGVPAGAGAEIAGQNDVNPLIGAGLGMGAGVGAVAGAGAARAGIEQSRRLLATPGVRQSLADERLARAVQDPALALDELDAAQELVPGSRPTTFQATGDLGLGGLERDTFNASREAQAAFTERREAQNTARRTAVEALKGDGNPEDVVTLLRDKIETENALADRGIAAERAAAQAAAERVGGTGSAEDYGRAMRGAAEDRRAELKAAENAAWDAVDADGSLTMPTVQTRVAVQRVYGDLPDAARITVKPVEKQIEALVEGWGPITTFRDVVALRKTLNAEMAQELRTSGRTPAWGRMAALRGDLERDMLGAARSRAAEEFDAINGGSMSFEDTMAARLKAQWNEWTARGEATRGDPGAASREPGLAVGGEGALPAAPRGDVPSAARLPDAAGDLGIQKAPARREGKPVSLTQFIARNGGIELDGDAKHYGWHEAKVDGRTRLARPGGVPVDTWRERLMEAGYIRPEPDGTFTRDIRNELYELVEAELKAGRKTYPVQHEARIGAAGEDPNADLSGAWKRIVAEHKTAGVRREELDGGALDEAAELLARGDETDALTAYERAVVRREYEDVPPTSRSIFDKVGPETAPRAPAGPLPNALAVDEAAYGRLRAASDATKARAKAVGTGVTGQMLRNAGDTGSYKMSDAKVAENVFRPGRDGGERLRSYLASVESRAEAREAVEEFAASSLRRYALREDGTIDPNRLSRWRNLHADALGELPPTVRAKFSEAGRASNALEQAEARAAVLRKERERSVLAKVSRIDPDDMPRELGRILTGAKSQSEVAKLMREVRGNPDAVKGLQRALAEYVEAQFISAKEVGTSGDLGLKANALQTFVRKNGPALALINPQGLKTLEGIADDMRRAERSSMATRLPGNSNSPQDLAPTLDKMQGKGSLLTQVLLAGGLGLQTGGVKGAALAGSGVLAKGTLSAMRARGMKAVDDLVVEMMLDPALARPALMKAANPKASEQALVKALGRSTATAIAHNPQ